MEEDSQPSEPEITAWLDDWRAGLTGADDRLANAIYPDLRKIASRFLHAERDNHTLEPNALVNEVWLHLTRNQQLTFQNRTHFFAVAATMMRHILTDHARARIAQRRGGPQQQVSLTAVEGWNPVKQNEDLLLVDQALTKLEKMDPRAAKVVELRFFGGLQEDELAEVLGVSLATVKRDWRDARAWLVSRLNGLK